MTRIIMRSAPTQTKPAGAVLLDWFREGGSANTIQHRLTPPRIGAASASALDFLRVAASVYCADKVVSRNTTADGWTREIQVRVPVSDAALWDAASSLREAVDYLSGDRWSFEFRVAPHPAQDPAARTVDAVALFSGGLDSLIGAIDFLTDNPDLRLGLVSHNEGAGVAPRVQSELVSKLKQRFGERVMPFNWFLRPAPRNGFQERPLPGTMERSTRARSLLFIAAGIVTASAQGSEVGVLIPENGFIGINVPLTRARVGSFSTRTTHPFFIDRVRTLLAGVGLEHPLTNPYSLKTKGEMVAGCSDPDLLRALEPMSVSCAHPEASRWAKLAQGNCGYCFPCLIRRASMHHADLDDPSAYAFDALTDSKMWTRSKRGRDLRAVIAAVRRGVEPIDVLRNGPVPVHRRAFVAVWARGLAELRALLEAKGSDRVVAELESEK